MHKSSLTIFNMKMENDQRGESNGQRNSTMIRRAPPTDSENDVILENAIDNVGSDRSTSTKDGRVAQFLSEFLAHLSALAGFLSRTALADLQRHVSVIGRLMGWHRRHHGGFLLDDLHVASRENALMTRSFVTALPPLRIHILGDLNSIIGLDLQVPGILCVILVQSRCLSQVDWGRWGGGVCRRRRHVVDWSAVVCIVVVLLLVRVAIEIQLSHGWDRSGLLCAWRGRR